MLPMHWQIDQLLNVVNSRKKISLANQLSLIHICSETKSASRRANSYLERPLVGDKHRPVLRKLLYYLRLGRVCFSHSQAEKSNTSNKLHKFNTSSISSVSDNDLQSGKKRLRGGPICPPFGGRNAS